MAKQWALPRFAVDYFNGTAGQERLAVGGDCEQGSSLRQ
jgi:hypothetical protein